MVIKHRPGKNHGNADGLSRIVEDEAACPNYLSGVELWSVLTELSTK
jgi:hypothetical protein